MSPVTSPPYRATGRPLNPVLRLYLNLVQKTSILSKREMSHIMRNDFMTKHILFRKQSVFTQFIDREYYDSLASSFLNLPRFFRSCPASSGRNACAAGASQNRIIMILLRPLF